MSLQEILIVPAFQPFKEYIEQLEVLCKDHNLRLTLFSTNRLERKYLAIEGKSSVLVAFFTKPDPERRCNNLAWNRVYDSNSINDIRTLHDTVNKDTGKKIKCFIFQVWEEKEGVSIVIIPFDRLNMTERFKETGDFVIKEDERGFYLATSKKNTKIRLETGLGKLIPYAVR